MNQDNEQQRAAEVDPQVSDQYGSLASEQTPAHLDRTVLREATRAVRADNRMGSFGAWFRPVAFMAMVGLSLAIILDLSDTAIFEPAADMPSEAAPTVPARPGPANDSAGKNPSQSALSEIKRQEKLAPAESPTVDAPDTGKDNAASDSLQAEPGRLQKMRMEAAPADAPPPAAAVEDRAPGGDAFAVEAGIAEQRGRNAEAAIDANLQSQRSTAVQFSQPQAAISADSLPRVAPAVCSDQQKADVEEWWKCIESLRQSGLAEAADLEFENLRKNYPDFAPPE